MAEDTIAQKLDCPSGQPELCTGCGLCVSICPVEAIELRETPGGLLRPYLDRKRCIDCRLCSKLCPGDHLMMPPPPDDFEPLSGPILAAYIVKASDKAILSGGQSGGVVTALLHHGMKTGVFDSAAVTTMPEDGTLRPKMSLADEADAVIAAQESKYCPVSAETVLRQIVDDSTMRCAFVGVSCQVHALMNLQEHLNRKPLCEMVFGLLCKSIQSFAAIETMIAIAGVNLDEANHFIYRSKEKQGWPGKVLVADRHGNKFWLDPISRFGCKGLFTPARCRICFDRWNVFADISFGDPWGISKDPDGATVVLVRSRRGAEFFDHALKCGVVTTCELDVTEVVEGQRLSDARQEFSAYSAIWRSMGKQMPEYRLDQNIYSLPETVCLDEYKASLERSLLLEKSQPRRKLVRNACIALKPNKLRRVARRLKKGIKMAVERFLS